MSDLFSLPDDVLNALVGKVTQSFLEGIITQDEAASRLVGTGKFDNNEAALTYLKTDVVPQILQKLALIEDEILSLQEQAQKLRSLAGLNSTKAKEARTSKKISKENVSDDAQVHSLQ